MASSINSQNIVKIILITGDPGVGKTSLFKKLYDKLKQDQSKKVKGFYTKEIRDDNHTRIGFDVIDLNDENNRGPLARVGSQGHINWPKVGKYSVDIKSFENIALPQINVLNESTIYMIDEVGKMEMFSNQFERSVQNIMQKISGQKFLFIATVPRKNLSLSDKLKSHPCSKLYTVTFQNRNNLLDDIYKQILDSYAKI